MVATRKAKKVEKEKGGEEIAETVASRIDADNIDGSDDKIMDRESELHALSPDSMHNQAELRNLLSTLLHLVHDPTGLLQPRPDIALSARSLSTSLYSYCLRHLLSSSTKGEAKALRGQGSNYVEALLPDLHASEGFDVEQIWMQLELASGATLRRVRRLMGKAEGADKAGPESLVKPEFLSHVDDLVDGVDGGQSGEDEDEDEDEPDEVEELEEDDMENGDDMEDEDDDMEEVDKKVKKRGMKESRSSGLSVEDEHFKLSEMERFLEDAEAKASREDDDEGDFDDEDKDEEDEEEGQEGDFDEDEEEEEDEEMADLLRNSAQIVGKKTGCVSKKKGEDSRGLMYRDFYGGGAQGDDEFGEGEGEEEEGDDEDEGEDQGEDQGEDDEPGQDDDMEEEEEEGGGKQRGSKPKSWPATNELSTHEKRLARLQEKISELERVAMAEKEWQLRGEAGSVGRPINSALEVDLDFETTIKPPPQPTEELMADIESMIKKRITEHKFDNVLRLVPPPLVASKRTVELDESRSKKGLGEIYESDFVDKRDEAGGFESQVGGKDKDAKIRLEAKALFNALVAKLDALSHFHFTPKPAVEELVVRTDVAAVLMEEAAPVTVR